MSGGIRGYEQGTGSGVSAEVTVSKSDSSNIVGLNVIGAPYIYNEQVDSVDTNLTYIGSAEPGTLTNAASWRVLRVDNTTGSIILYADGDTKFDNVFDDRQTLSYS